MKIHDLDPEIIVKVNMDSCKDDCPKKLEKYLMDISGVYTVMTDPKKSLFTIRGKVDPVIVLKAIAKTGHSAELLSYQKEPEIDEDEIKKHVCPEKHQPKTKEDYDYDDHEIEDYVPPPIDFDVCRDPYCKRHRRRPIITNSVPPRYNGDHPHHADGRSPFGFRYPRMSPAGYGYYSRRPGHGFDHGYARGCTIM